MFASTSATMTLTQHRASNAEFRAGATRASTARRCATVRVRALFGKPKDKMARDAIDLSKRKISEAGSIVGAPVKVTFLGANNSRVEVECGSEQYILDAGLDAGIEIPFTCRGGICGACVARVAKGAVDQSDITDLEFTLSEDEIEAGMALLCMARPVGDVEIETQSDWGYSLGTTEWKGATGEILGRDPTPLMGDSDRVGL
jgi:2Fe-2S type ferredoxin